MMNKKKTRIISAIIAGILAFAMIATMVAGALSSIL